MAYVSYKLFLIKHNACIKASDSLRASDAIQGDTSRCLKPPVDFKTKVPFWPRQVRTTQAKMELLF